MPMLSMVVTVRERTIMWGQGLKKLEEEDNKEE